MTTRVQKPGGGKSVQLNSRSRVSEPGDKAAAQVVEELPSRERADSGLLRRPAAARNPGQQPAEQLPVAANPAMAAAHVGAVAAPDILRRAARRSAGRSARSSLRADRG